MSDSALDWIEKVVANLGISENATQVRISHSQAELARRTQRSAGTISYYLRNLVPIVERGDSALIVNIAALAERRKSRQMQRTQIVRDISQQQSEMTADGTSIETANSLRSMAKLAGRSAGTVHKQLRGLENDGLLDRSNGRFSLIEDEPKPTPAVNDELLPVLVETISALAEITARLTSLAERVIDITSGSDVEPANPRERATNFADEPANCATNFAAFAGANNTQNFSDLKKERKLLSFSKERDPRTTSREPSRPVAGSRLEKNTIREIVKPLEDACRKAAGVTISELDDSGLRMLEGLTQEELRAGVGNALSRLRSGHSNSPLGLLCAKARSRDKEFFAVRVAAASVSAPDVEITRVEVDIEADAAVAAMSNDQLAVLDEVIAAEFSPQGMERARKRPEQMNRMRRDAWRKRQEVSASGKTG